ncbi:protein containing Aldehyde dehydrogenase domain protein, partial [human gut metagenome]
GRLAERLKGMKIGDPLDQGSRIGPLIDERAAQRVEEIVDRTVKSRGVLPVRRQKI